MKRLTQKSLKNYFLPCQVHVDHAKTEQKKTLDSNGNKLGREETIRERAPTPLLRSPPLAAAAAPPRFPVRRRIDFTGDGGLGDDDHEAKRRATQGLAPPPAFREKPCVCGRGPCDVVWDERGGWAYVCSSAPKCFHFAWCEESDRNLNPQPAYRSHPEPSNPRAFNTPSNHRAGATTPVNVSPQGAGTTPPVNVSPQGAGATTPVNVSPEGARSNGKWPICKCAAGKCRKLTVEGVDYYICHIGKGQGACSYRVLVNAAAEKPQQNGDNNPRENKHLEYNPVKKEANGHNLVDMGENNENGPVNPDQPEDDEWPFDIVDDDIVPSAVATCETPSMLHKPIAMVELETQTKSPVPPNGTASLITPRSNCCFRCGEGGHWSKNCPKPPPPCSRCGEVGHRSRDCPRFSPQPDTCFHCGEVGHWKISCPVLRDRRAS